MCQNDLSKYIILNIFFRQARGAGVTKCDVYYIPPQDGRYRTREAKRKRRSKKDQERYFEDFPDDDLSIKNFNYVKKPMGLNNAAYEVVRQAKLQDACKCFFLPIFFSYSNNMKIGCSSNFF